MGLVVAGAFAPAHVAESTFQGRILPCEKRMILLSETAFHATEGDPSNLKLCQRGEWQDRLLVETVRAMLTLVSHFKKAMHRGLALFKPVWRSPWPPAMCWSSGMVSSPTRRASYPSRWLRLVCKIPIALFGLSETNTIG